MENEEIHYKRAAEQLRNSEPLFGKDAALAPMLERILNAALGGWDGYLKSKRPLKGGWEAVEREMGGRRKEGGRWLLGWSAMGLCRGWKRARAPVECVPPMPVGRWVCRVFILGRPGRVPRA